MTRPFPSIYTSDTYASWEVLLPQEISLEGGGIASERSSHPVDGELFKKDILKGWKIGPI